MGGRWLVPSSLPNRPSVGMISGKKLCFRTLQGDVRFAPELWACVLRW